MADTTGINETTSRYWVIAINGFNTPKRAIDITEKKVDEWVHRSPFHCFVVSISFTTLLVGFALLLAYISPRNNVLVYERCPHLPDPIPPVANSTQNKLLGFCVRGLKNCKSGHDTSNISFSPNVSSDMYLARCVLEWSVCKRRDRRRRRKIPISIAFIITIPLVSLGLLVICALFGVSVCKRRDKEQRTIPGPAKTEDA